jgi:hypothetical protein
MAERSLRWKLYNRRIYLPSFVLEPLVLQVVAAAVPDLPLTPRTMLFWDIIDEGMGYFSEKGRYHFGGGERYLDWQWSEKRFEDGATPNPLSRRDTFTTIGERDASVTLIIDSDVREVGQVQATFRGSPEALAEAQAILEEKFSTPTA